MLDILRRMRNYWLARAVKAATIEQAEACYSMAEMYQRFMDTEVTR